MFKVSVKNKSVIYHNYRILFLWIDFILYIHFYWDITSYKLSSKNLYLYNMVMIISRMFFILFFIFWVVFFLLHLSWQNYLYFIQRIPWLFLFYNPNVWENIHYPEVLDLRGSEWIEPPLSHHGSTEWQYLVCGLVSLSQRCIIHFVDVYLFTFNYRVIVGEHIIPVAVNLPPGYLSHDVFSQGRGVCISCFLNWI